MVALADEVESLTAARAGAMAGTEPTDALRVKFTLITNILFSRTAPQVVNALLTQLDKLRHKKNVLVVSTSNLAKAIGQYEPRLSSGANTHTRPRLGFCRPCRHCTIY
jgi:pachytene checkpoint protein 2